MLTLQTAHHATPPLVLFDLVWVRRLDDETQLSELRFSEVSLLLLVLVVEKLLVAGGELMALVPVMLVLRHTCLASVALRWAAAVLVRAERGAIHPHLQQLADFSCVVRGPPPLWTE